MSVEMRAAITQHQHPLTDSEPSPAVVTLTSSTFFWKIRKKSQSMAALESLTDSLEPLAAIKIGLLE